MLILCKMYKKVKKITLIVETNILIIDSERFNS